MNAKLFTLLLSLAVSTLNSLKAESRSGQRIVDLAVSMKGFYADEVGTNLTVSPYALARHLATSSAFAWMGVWTA